MPAPSLSGLCKRPKYRKPQYAGTKKSTWGMKEARAEDAYRARALQRSAERLGKRQRKQAKCLARQLSYNGKPPRTTASSACMHKRCEAVLDDLVRLTHGLAPDDLRVAALLPNHSRLPSLKGLTAKKFVERLRADFNRAGGAMTAGFVFVGLHGEWDPVAGKYRPHYHLVIVGRDMIALVDKMRGKRKYKSLAMVEEREARTPVRLQTVNPDELRYTLSYALQSFWPKRTQLAAGRSPRRRLPEPQHTEWLLWMAEQRFEDLFLLYGLRVGRNGLEPTRW